MYKLLRLALCLSLLALTIPKVLALSVDITDGPTFPGRSLVPLAMTTTEDTLVFTTSRPRDVQFINTGAAWLWYNSASSANTFPIAQNQALTVRIDKSRTLFLKTSAGAGTLYMIVVK